METDDDDATIRERFSLVQSILFIDFTDILPANFQEKMVESCGETMQLGLVSLITDSGGNSWCPWLYFLRAYHVDNLCSSKSDVRLRFDHMRIIISGQGEKERFHVCPPPPHWSTSQNSLAS